QGFVATLALPTAAVVVKGLGLAGPAVPPAAGLNALFAPAQAGTDFGSVASIFLIYWFASVVLWAWNQEFRPARIATGASVFALAAAAFLIFGVALSSLPLRSFAVGFLWLCGLATFVLG